jgi:hypothetical protein
LSLVPTVVLKLPAVLSSSFGSLFQNPSRRPSLQLTCFSPTPSFQAHRMRV